MTMTIQDTQLVEHPQLSPLTPASTISSTELSPTNDTVPADNKKRKKKKKSNKSVSSANDLSPTLPRKPTSDAAERPPVLCISRNKHWKYISSYHGPWLQLPLELLESLLVLNLDPSTLSHAKTPSQVLHSSRSLNPPHPFALNRSREPEKCIPDQVPPELHCRTFNLPPHTATPLLWPIPGKPTPPPIDPGVFRNVASIRRLIDEAAELSVRASSGLSSTALGSLRVGGGGSAWPSAQNYGLDVPGNMGNGRNVAMSAMRIHRLRALAVQKLAAAYKADEIASSVMVMQGGSVFDDIAERVLKHDPGDSDAKYVHFFHEKIPSRANRQLAESTTTQVLDELIAANPQCLEYYRTRGIVRCFRDEYTLAAKDFTYALKEARSARKGRTIHHGVTLPSESRGKTAKKKKGSNKIHGRAPANGTCDSAEGTTIEGPDGEPLLVHPSVSPNAPDPIEPQLLFLRGATYLQHALYLIESAILKLEGVNKAGSPDGTELRLCYLINGRYGGVEIGNPDGPLGKSSGPKACAYRSVLSEERFREDVCGYLRKCIRDHERFLAHYDTVEGPPMTSGQVPLDLPRRVEIAVLLSETARPGGHSAGLAGAESGLPPMFTTYHPLLVESHFTILICQLMLAELPILLTTFARTAVLMDGLEGYPVFLPPRSMAQAEFMEVLERLASGWKTGIQPHAALRARIARRVAARSITNRAAIAAPGLSDTPYVGSSSSATASTSVSVPAYASTFTSTSFPSPASSSSTMTASCSTSFPSPASSTSTASCSTSLYSPASPSTAASQLKLTRDVDLAESLDCARILLVPVAARQRERTAQYAAATAASSSNNAANGNGAKKKPLNINIPLHGPRVEIILAWLAAVHLVELESVA